MGVVEKPREMKISIVIPNWNGEKLLRKNLPAVLEVGADEIIIVDNGSTDKSVEEIQKLKLKIILNKSNLGFGRAVNQGVKEAKGEIIVLLNNDVAPEKDFLKYTLPHFKNPEVFAVSFHEPNWSWARILWQKGFIEHQPGGKAKTAHISAWASGGSAAFRKSIWQKLGGFDSLYHPFYWEDTDLSYRAWKRGYKILWEPKAVVHHKHEGTISRFSQDYVRLISQRNQLLFIWKNITSLKMRLEHKFWLFRKLFVTPGYWKPFLAALAKLPVVLPGRFKEWREEKVSDEEILEFFNPTG